MPEGDTIHRAANTLRRVLEGEVVARYWAYRPELMHPRRSGHVVTEVQARGKNLLIHFDDDRALYSHMRMTGSWHVYRPDESWQKARPQARVIIETEAHVAVCFSAPVIELLTGPQISRHPTLSTLGPDLLAEPLDEEEILRRLGKVEHVPLGEAIMDQRVLAGIGNVYKSEMLFLAELNPFAPVSTVSVEARRELITNTRTMMQANLTTSRRTTRRSPGGHLWVYERSRRPCLRCRRRVQMRRQGDQGRSTYFCAKCQRVPQIDRRAPRHPRY